MQDYRLVRSCEKEWTLEVPAVLTNEEVGQVINFLYDKGCSADIKTSQFTDGFTIIAVPGCQIVEIDSYKRITKCKQTSEICSL